MLAEGAWTLDVPFTPQARADLAAFDAIMVERFFGGLSQACRRVDPNHLNLGIRYYTIPPAWALDGMRHFDVFSMNCYRRRLPAEEMQRISEMMDMPIMIGEWHFGALDAGLPASGIGHVPDQAGRGKAYRIYLEDAAAKPWCVGRALLYPLRSVRAGTLRRRKLQHRFPGRVQPPLRCAVRSRARQPRKAVRRCQRRDGRIQR